MANKYIIHGAAIDGDGTQPTEATVAGGPGAWNNIAIFEDTAPTYGTLSPGDRVFIRSKAASGTNILRTAGVNTNIGSSTVQNIEWVVDDGTVWAGVVGSIVYETSATVTFLVQPDNVVVGNNLLTFRNPTSVTGLKDTGLVLLHNGSQLRSATVDMSAKTDTTSYPSLRLFGGAEAHGLFIRHGRTFYGPVISIKANYHKAYLTNIHVEKTSSAAGAQIVYSQGATILEIDGLRISGVGSATSQTVFKTDAGTSAGFIRARNCDWPRTMTPGTRPTYQNGFIHIQYTNLDADIVEAWGSATSRTNNNPPTLNARLPDGTAWSWRIIPNNTSHILPCVIPIETLYSDVPTAKTIRLHFQVSTDFAVADVNMNNCWLSISYVDNATGQVKSLTTRRDSSVSLPTSTAAWSSNSWGLVTLNPYFLELTTPTAIKQHSVITARFFWQVAQPNSNAILFLDPALELL